MLRLAQHLQPLRFLLHVPVGQPLRQQTDQGADRPPLVDALLDDRCTTATSGMEHALGVRSMGNADAAVAALRALHDGDTAGARTLADAVDTAGGLVGALRSFLAAPTKTGVYAEPSAFGEFITSGDNPDLYAATIGALQGLHHEVEPGHVLDIGCGDGRVTAGCLTPSTAVVDLLEPSAPLLSAARRALAASPASVNDFRCTMQTFMSTAPQAQRWDVSQSTFAFHSLDPMSRRDVLAWLSQRADTIALVEFDVPEHESGSAEHLSHLAERYEEGLAVYEEHPSVIGGFLMPVLVGQLDPNRTRHTWEQSADSWCSDLAAAGFRPASRPLFDHWWATAHLLVGHRD